MLVQIEECLWDKDSIFIMKITKKNNNPGTLITEFLEINNKNN